MISKTTVKIAGICFIISLLVIGCACNKTNTASGSGDGKSTVAGETSDSNIESAGAVNKASAVAQAVVYKTVKDYSSFVPVILSADKKKIISYPAPSDVYYKGKLAYPVALKNGYYLDNRGINENVAFTDFTYEEYSRLKSAPSMDELMKRIIDKFPLTEIIYCGPRANYSNETVDLNKLIDEGFKGMKIIRIAEMQVEL